MRKKFANFVEVFVSDTLKIKGKYSLKRVIVAIFVPYTLNIGMTIARKHNI